MYRVNSTTGDIIVKSVTINKKMFSCTYYKIKKKQVKIIRKSGLLLLC